MSRIEILALVGSGVLVLFAAVLAVAETAFTHLGRARAEAIDNARSGKSKDGNGDDETDPAHAGVLVDLLARRGQVLNPVLFLVLVCHLAVATIVTVVVHDRWGVEAVLIGFCIELVVIYVVAEAAPKTWALEHTDTAAVRVAPLVRGLAALAPLRWVLRLLIGLANLLVPGRGRREGPSVSEEELLALAGVAARGGRHRRLRAHADRVDHRLRGHHRPRGHGPPHRDGHRRRGLPGRRRHRDRHRPRLQPAPRLRRRRRRRHHRRDLREGPHAGRA